MNSLTNAPNVPLPELGEPAQRVADAVMSWAGVSAAVRPSLWRKDRANEPDAIGFHLGSTELGHIHFDSEAHVIVHSRVADTLVRAGLVRRTGWASNQVAVVIDDPSTIRRAIWLFRLSYRRQEELPVDDVAAMTVMRSA